MNKRLLAIGTGVLGVAIALAATLWNGREPQRPDATAASETPRRRLTAVTAPPAEAPPLIVQREIQPSSGVAPVGLAGDEERLAFQQRVRDFMRHAPRLDAATREAHAAQLEADFSRYEADRTLSAGEAMVLRAEIIRLTVADELTRAERLTELTERYRAEARRRYAAMAAMSDPQLVEYQARERAIVQEVAAMTTIPGGLSREEYLRQRLQRERELTFR